MARTYAWQAGSRPLRSVARSLRPGRSRPPAVGVGLGAHAAAALAAVVAAHGIDARPQPQGDSVVWCSRARVSDQDVDDGDPRWCTDLWVHLDREDGTIAASIEGHGLAEHVTGRTHWDGPVVELADDLDDALAVLAGHLDRLCADVVTSS